MVVAGKEAVLVTGSRYWTRVDIIHRKLAELKPGAVIIHGNAVGADEIADNEAGYLGLARIRVPYIGKLGKPGGPVRNRLMLNILVGLEHQGYIGKVYAFHDSLDTSAGTADMCKQADHEHIPVYQFTTYDDDAARVK